MSAHTPGPWRLHFWPENVGICADRPSLRDCVSVASVYRGPEQTRADERDESEANARLIAAAPELLALVERAREELRLLREKDGAGPYDPTLRGHLDAAVAKARGGK